MSSIAASAGPERTNRWFLIAGVALAALTGILVFVALSRIGGDDGGSSSLGAAGDAEVLVANETISQGSKLTAEQFKVASFSEDDLVPKAISDPEAIIGQTATTEILKGQQLSQAHVAAATDDKRADQLTFKVPDGHRGIGVAVDEVSTFGGLVVPGDRVDVVVTFKEKESADANAREFARVETLMQNVLVLAREQTDIQRVNPLVGEAEATGDDAGAAGEDVTTSEEFAQRPEDFDPEGSVGVVTLALTPYDVQQLVMAMDLGEVTLVLRQFGEDTVVPIENLRQQIFE